MELTQLEEKIGKKMARLAAYLAGKLDFDKLASDFKEWESIYINDLNLFQTQGLQTKLLEKCFETIQNREDAESVFNKASQRNNKELMYQAMEKYLDLVTCMYHLDWAYSQYKQNRLNFLNPIKRRHILLQRILKIGVELIYEDEGKRIRSWIDTQDGFHRKIKEELFKRIFARYLSLTESTQKLEKILKINESAFRNLFVIQCKESIVRRYAELVQSFKEWKWVFEQSESLTHYSSPEETVKRMRQLKEKAFKECLKLAKSRQDWMWLYENNHRVKYLHTKLILSKLGEFLD